MLTAERLRELLHYDPATACTWIAKVGPRSGIRIGSIAGRLNSNGHLQISVDGRRYMGHPLAYLYMNGAWPKNLIDHINMDMADNRWCNLRDATHSQNLCNARRSRRNS
jgi:hypothetical protein